MEIEFRTKVPASKVSKSAPDGFYTVVMYEDQSWACSCPHWIYRLKASNEICKHIKSVIMNPSSYGYIPIGTPTEQIVQGRNADGSRVQSRVQIDVPIPAKVKRYINLQDDEL